MITPTPADILRQAADLIEPEGAWWQGSFHNEDGTAFCAREAIRRSVPSGKPNILITTLGALRETIRENTGLHIFLDIPHWNDDPKRTQQEVVDAFRLAAKRWEEENELGLQ